MAEMRVKGVGPHWCVWICWALAWVDGTEVNRKMEILKAQECDISPLINGDGTHVKREMRSWVHAFEDLLLETKWGNLCVCTFLLNILCYQHLSATERSASNHEGLGCSRWWLKWTLGSAAWLKRTNAGLRPSHKKKRHMIPTLKKQNKQNKARRWKQRKEKGIGSVEENTDLYKLRKKLFHITLLFYKYS